MLGWQDGAGRCGVPGVMAGFGDVPEVCILCAEVCCGQKGFWDVMLKRVFE